MNHPGRSGLGREHFLRLSAAAGGAAVLAGVPRSATAGTPLHCAPPTPPGPPTPWAGDSRAIQTRPSAYALSAAYLTKLQNAYAAMRALPVSDGRSFQAQANIHGWWCGGCGDGMMAPGGGIHYKWTFFLWHRAYLYFHEKILGHLIGDPTFRLPYWDWDNPAHLVMPPGFTTPGSSANSLYNGTRFLGPSTPLPAAGVNAATMSAIYALTGWDPFGGNPASGGAVENQPHGYVHVKVGGDMGSFATAAQDPIFYAHHCNVDRVWAHWKDDLTPARPAPPPGYFGSTAWTFYDENKNWVSITPADVLDHAAQLRYNYTGGIILRTPFPYRTIGPFRTPFPLRTIPIIYQKLPPFTIPGPDPIINVSPQQRSSVIASARAGQRVAIGFQNIIVPPGATGIIDIKSDGKVIGYLAIVPDSPDGKTMHAIHASAVVEVTAVAERVFAANAAPRLTLEPQAGGRQFTPVPLRAARAHIVAF
jgi:hypothetical protein